VVPKDVAFLAAGMDLRVYLAQWVVAQSPQARGHMVEQGTLEVPNGSMGVEQVLMATLREFKDLV
jgi:hypothetical protein